MKFLCDPLSSIEHSLLFDQCDCLEEGRVSLCLVNDLFSMIHINMDTTQHTIQNNTSANIFIVAVTR